MDVYVFLLRLEPTAGSAHAENARFALADVWVAHPDKEEARAKAIAYVMDYAWKLVAVERELLIPAEQISRYRTDAQANFRAALANGISACFVVDPLEERDDGVIEIRSLGRPSHPSGTSH